MNYLPFIIPGALVPVIIAIVVLGRRAERRRTEAMRAAAASMGFTFEQRAGVDAIRSRAPLPLFERGRSKYASNVVTGRADGRDVLLFDYQYTTGGGKNSHTYRQTVALFSGAASGLPAFVLEPENVLHKIGQVLGYQDIDFESYPTFSSRYLLRGRDESAIRAAFSPDILSFLGQRQGWHVEAQGDAAVIYRSGKRCAPEALSAFLEETRTLVRVLNRG